MKVETVIGIVISIVVLVTVSIFSGKKAKREKGANSFLVAGAIMGTLVVRALVSKATTTLCPP